MLGCYHCQNTFPPWAVVDCVTERDGRQTMLCPLCGIDAVTDATEPLELAARHRQAFSAWLPVDSEYLIRRAP